MNFSCAELQVIHLTLVPRFHALLERHWGYNSLMGFIIHVHINVIFTLSLK